MSCPGPHHAPNGLLATLSPEVRRQIEANSKLIKLLNNKILCEAGDPVTRAFFPQGCVISVGQVSASGSSCEVALVGREGVAPVALVLEGEASLARYVVRVPGAALVCEEATLRSLMNHSRSLQGVLFAYARSFVSHALLSVSCAALHSVEQRIARWLLMMADGAAANSYPLTHEFLAEMLAVHRPTVSVAAGNLQNKGLIRYRYGVMTITDRTGLQAASCECYALARQTRPFQRGPR